MKNKLKILIAVISVIMQGAIYANDEHQLKISKNDFFIDDRYCFSIGDDKAKLINCFGQADYIEEIPGYDGYVYYEYNLGVDVDYENKIASIYYYFQKYPFGQSNFNVTEFIIDGLKFCKNAELNSICGYLDKNKVRYSIDSQSEHYSDVTVYSEAGGRIKKYYFRFYKNEDAFILERILF